LNQRNERCNELCNELLMGDEDERSSCVKEERRPSLGCTLHLPLLNAVAGGNQSARGRDVNAGTWENIHTVFETASAIREARIYSELTIWALAVSGEGRLLLFGSPKPPDLNHLNSPK
jgi:hypothetical protein